MLKLFGKLVDIDCNPPPLFTPPPSRLNSYSKDTPLRENLTEALALGWYHEIY
jgi:hypothetical protein